MCLFFSILIMFLTYLIRPSIVDFASFLVKKYNISVTLRIIIHVVWCFLLLYNNKYMLKQESLFTFFVYVLNLFYILFFWLQSFYA